MNCRFLNSGNRRQRDTENGFARDTTCEGEAAAAGAEPPCRYGERAGPAAGLKTPRGRVPEAPSLGPRLQEARKRLDLTLEQLARISGISKSMLSQIERGQANPTFATLWNIAHALGLDIGSMIGEVPPGVAPSSKVEVMRAHSTPTLRSADGRCVLRIVSPVETASRFEWYQLIMDQGGLLESEPHARGTVEHLTCLSGDIRVLSGNDEQRLSPGDTARYRGDVPHAIGNIGDGGAAALLVLLYSSPH
jgi:transcriptional regulator with XRE-family HTH domain